MPSFLQHCLSWGSETWCVPSVLVWWEALCDTHDSGEVASTTHCFRLWWQPFHQLPASEWRLKTEQEGRGGLVETNFQLEESSAIVWNSQSPQQPDTLTLRLNEIIGCERVPVFFVLQTRRVKVLADHMQVHMTVKDKEIIVSMSNTRPHCIWQGWRQSKKGQIVKHVAFFPATYTQLRGTNLSPKLDCNTQYGTSPRPPSFTKCIFQYDRLESWL